MKIVQYHPRALVGDGGVSNSVRRLSAAMAAEGVDAAIAYEGADGPPPGDDPFTWVPVRHRGRASFRVPVDLDRALQGADLLILNSGWTAHNARAGAVARAAGVPYVVAPRGAYDARILKRRPLVKRLWWAALERKLVMGSSAAHVFFPSQVDELRALGYTGGVLVAPNGVEVPDGVRWDGGSGGYVLYIGRFDPEHKGLDLLCEAVASLPPADRPAVRLHGPDWRGGKRLIDQLVERLGVRDSVTIGPPVYGDEKWSLLASAAGFVYPSRWEAFGNAPAEAAALGVPTLVTAYPLGLYLAERGAALLVEETTDGIARGVLALFDPGAGETGRRAATLVGTEFSWPTVARSWIAQAATLAGSPGTP